MGPLYPVSLALITAIGVGITSTVTDATKASLVASYTALKKKISSLHHKVSQALAELEVSPTSQARQAVLVEEVSTAKLPQDSELLNLAQTLLHQVQQTPAGSQIIQHVQNSAVSNTGTANNYNIQGDQHITH